MSIYRTQQSQYSNQKTRPFEEIQLLHAISGYLPKRCCCRCYFPKETPFQDTKPWQSSSNAVHAAGNAQSSPFHFYHPPIFNEQIPAVSHLVITTPPDKIIMPRSVIMPYSTHLLNWSSSSKVSTCHPSWLPPNI